MARCCVCYRTLAPGETGCDCISCFPRGTKISTPYGVADIATLKKGDMVNSFCIKTNSITARRIIKTISHPSRKIWNLRFEEEKIRTTSFHSFRTTSGWKVASNIKCGDKVMCCDRSGSTSFKIVTESSPTNDIEDVFNLVIEKDFNFIAEGFIAHSFTYFRTLRCLLWSLPRLNKSKREIDLNSGIN